MKNLQRLIANFDKENLTQGEKKSDLNCSNRYETLYITDSTTESESEDPNYITYTGTSTDNNTRPGYTCRLYQQNDDLKQVNKTKNEIMENVNK